VGRLRGSVLSVSEELIEFHEERVVRGVAATVATASVRPRPAGPQLELFRCGDRGVSAAGGVTAPPAFGHGVLLRRLRQSRAADRAGDGQAGTIRRCPPIPALGATVLLVQRHVLGEVQSLDTQVQSLDSSRIWWWRGGKVDWCDFRSNESRALQYLHHLFLLPEMPPGSLANGMSVPDRTTTSPTETATSGKRQQERRVPRLHRGPGVCHCVTLSPKNKYKTETGELF